MDANFPPSIASTDQDATSDDAASEDDFEYVGNTLEMSMTSESTDLESEADAVEPTGTITPINAAAEPNAATINDDSQILPPSDYEFIELDERQPWPEEDHSAYGNEGGDEAGDESQITVKATDIRAVTADKGTQAYAPETEELIVRSPAGETKLKAPKIPDVPAGLFRSPKSRFLIVTSALALLFSSITFAPYGYRSPMDPQTEMIVRKEALGGALAQLNPTPTWLDSVDLERMLNYPTVTADADGIQSTALAFPSAISVDVVQPDELFVSLPKMLPTKEYSTSKVYINVSKATRSLECNSTLLIPGVVFLQMNKDDAHGFVEVSILITSEPSLNETVKVDLGSRFFQLWTRSKAATHDTLEIQHAIDAYRTSFFSRTHSAVHTFHNAIRNMSVGINSSTIIETGLPSLMARVQNFFPNKQSLKADFVKARQNAQHINKRLTRRARCSEAVSNEEPVADKMM